MSMYEINCNSVSLVYLPGTVTATYPSVASGGHEVLNCSLSLIVSRYLLLSRAISHCLALSLIVSRYLSLSRELPMFHHYNQRPINVNKYMSSSMLGQTVTEVVECHRELSPGRNVSYYM